MTVKYWAGFMKTPCWEGSFTTATLSEIADSAAATPHFQFHKSCRIQTPVLGGLGLQDFGWGLCPLANYPLKTQAKLWAGCHAIWGILLQMGRGFKIIWYRAMSSWETGLERVPLQALPTGRQQQSQELNPWLPRPILVAEPQDHSSPLPAIAPAEGLQVPCHTRTSQAE